MRMLGPLTNPCPHGRWCTDNPPPGKARTQARRSQRRRERQQTARALRREPDAT